jgi:RNA polymerase sigma-70 factor (ECF subfamily)
MGDLPLPNRAPAEMPTESKTLDFDELYSSYFGEVERWCRRLAGPGDDIEDFIHEVFMVVHRRLPEWRGEAKITTWLFAICERIGKKRRRKGRLRQLTRSWSTVLMGSIPSAEASPLEQLERREQTGHLYQALERLEDKYRTTLILFELEGISGEDIAQLTGASLATVWVRLHRGRAKLVAAMLRETAAEVRR